MPLGKESEMPSFRTTVLHNKQQNTIMEAAASRHAVCTALSKEGTKQT